MHKYAMHVRLFAAHLVTAALLAMAPPAVMANFDGNGPERLAMLDQFGRIWVDDPELPGQWKDITGNLQTLNGTAIVSHFTLSQRFVWVANHRGEVAVCQRPCSGTWTRWAFPHWTAHAHGDGIYMAMQNSPTDGLYYWDTRGGFAPLFVIGTGYANAYFIAGGSRYVHTLVRNSAGARIDSHERQANGQFVALPAGFINTQGLDPSMIAMSGDELIMLAHGLLWQYNYTTRSMTLITNTPASGTFIDWYAVGSTWLWRVYSNTSRTSRWITKSMLPCTVFSCRELSVPLPAGVSPQRIAAF